MTKGINGLEQSIDTAFGEIQGQIDTTQVTRNLIDAVHNTMVQEPILILTGGKNPPIRSIAKAKKYVSENGEREVILIYDSQWHPQAKKGAAKVKQFLTKDLTGGDRYKLTRVSQQNLDGLTHENLRIGQESSSRLKTLIRKSGAREIEIHSNNFGKQEGQVILNSGIPTTYYLNYKAGPQRGYKQGEKAGITAAGTVVVTKSDLERYLKSEFPGAVAKKELMLPSTVKSTRLTTDSSLNAMANRILTYVRKHSDKEYADVLEKIFRRGLSQNPNTKYSDSSELQTDLESLQTYHKTQKGSPFWQSVKRIAKGVGVGVPAVAALSYLLSLAPGVGKHVPAFGEINAGIRQEWEREELEERLIRDYARGNSPESVASLHSAVLAQAWRSMDPDKKKEYMDAAKKYKDHQEMDPDKRNKAVSEIEAINALNGMDLVKKDSLLRQARLRSEWVNESDKTQRDKDVANQMKRNAWNGLTGTEKAALQEKFKLQAIVDGYSADQTATMWEFTEMDSVSRFGVANIGSRIAILGALPKADIAEIISNTTVIRGYEKGTTVDSSGITYTVIKYDAKKNEQHWEFLKPDGSKDILKEKPGFFDSVGRYHPKAPDGSNAKKTILKADYNRPAYNASNPNVIRSPADPNSPRRVLRQPRHRKLRTTRVGQ